MKSLELNTGATVTFSHTDDGVVLSVISHEEKRVNVLQLSIADFSYLISPERHESVTAA